MFDLGRSVLSPPYSPYLASNNFHIFLLNKDVLNNKKIYQEKQLKTLVKNFLRSKQAEFYLEESRKHQMEWFKTISYVRLIEINLFLNYAQINYILLKQKVFMIKHSGYDCNQIFKRERNWCFK